MARFELSQSDIRGYYNVGKTMIWQYRTLYQIGWDSAQSVFRIWRVQYSDKPITLPGRFIAMLPEEAARY